MVVMRVRRVEAVSPSVRVGSVVSAGEPLGVDWLGREIREETDSVVVTVDRYADFWLVGLRTVDLHGLGYLDFTAPSHRVPSLAVMGKIERERKYRLTEDGVSELRHRLVAFGDWLSREAEADVFFDHPRLRLAENDQRLRLRFHGEDGSRELTFKGPRRFDRGDKLRLEVSAALAGGQIEEILSNLGFTKLQQFVKLRETYRLGNAVVRLDELDPIGWFCELEALADDVSLDSVAAGLRLHPSTLEPRSYPELIDEAAEHAASIAS